MADAMVTDPPAADQAQATAEQALHGEAANGEAAPAAPADPMLEKYNQQYAAARDKPEDFTVWTSLLSTADKLDAAHITYTRAAYDSFLAEFPLCFGYWKKYAEAEKRAENIDVAVQVYERGAQSVPYSPEIWAAYAGFLQARGRDAADIRQVFERGLAYVAADYNGHTLWDKYITFEQEHGSSLTLVALYPRILACPLKELDRYYKAVQLLAHTKPLEELMPPEAATQLKEALAAAKQQAAAAAADSAVKKEEPAAAAAAAGGEDAPPGADDTDMPDAPPGAEPGEAAAAADAGAAPSAEAAASSSSSSLEVTDQEVKDAWLQQCTAVYEATREAVLGPRKPFEEKLKRSYYHFKPLDGTQLTTWVAYLDWVEGTGDIAAAIHLYERCLVPCANYPEFWMRYIRWLDVHNPDTAPAALQRAALLFCKRRAEMLLFAAQYEERHGQPTAAWATFTRLLAEVAPGWLQGITAAANFQRRAGNKEMACSVYEAAITQLTQGLAAGEGQQQAAGSSSKAQELVFLALQYAQFLSQMYSDAPAARQVVSSALDAVPDSKALWEGAVWLEQQLPGEDRVGRVCALFERALQPPQAAEQPAATAVKAEAGAGEAAPGADGSAPAAEGAADAATNGSSVESAAAAAAVAAAPKQLDSGDREALSSQYIEFLDMYGDAELLAKVQQRHTKEYFLPPSAVGSAAGDASRKRAAEAAADTPAAKAARAEDAAGSHAGAAAGMGPDAAAAAAAAAGYGYPPPPAGGYGGYPPYGGWYGGYGYGY